MALRAVFVLTPLLLFALLAWLLAPSLWVPWSPAHLIALEGSRFTVVLGQGSVQADGLRMTSSERAGEALAVTSLEAIPAEQFSLLRYQVTDFSRVQELSLMWRRAEDPDEVHAKALPAALDSDGLTVRLDDLDDWNGTIIEIGLASFPLAQQVPLDQDFQPWTLRQLELQSESRSGLLAALWLDWTAFQPWSPRSVNSLGREIESRSSLSVSVVAASCAVVFGIVLWLLGRQRGMKSLTLPQALGLAFLLCWLLLDVRWQRTLSQQLELSSQLFAGKTWRERERLQPDRQLLEDLDIARGRLSDLEPHTRIFVLSPLRYASRRAVFHLTPMNAVDLPLNSPPLNVRPWEPGEVLLFYEHPAWLYEPRSRRLEFGDSALRAERLYQSERMGVFRVLDPVD